MEAATAPFNNWELRNYVIDVRKNYDQYIDRINPDEITAMGWVADSRAKAESLVQEFTRWIEAHKEEITALQLFYAQPFWRRELSYKMIKDLVEAIKADKPTKAPVEGTIPFREANTPSTLNSSRATAAGWALRSPLMARLKATAGTTAAYPPAATKFTRCGIRRNNIPGSVYSVWHRLDDCDGTHLRWGFEKV